MSETLSVEPQQNFLVLDLKLGPAFRTARTSKAQLVMGPIVGAVTETTAIIAAETNKAQQLTCTVVNQLTNVSACQVRRIRTQMWLDLGATHTQDQLEQTLTVIAFRPVGFLFTGLAPNTPCQCWFSPADAGSQVLGYFRTLPACPSAQTTLLRNDSPSDLTEWKLSFVLMGDDCPAAQLAHMSRAAEPSDLEDAIQSRARANMQQAVGLCHQLATWCRDPTSGVSCVMHFGWHTDHTYTLRDAVAKLTTGFPTVTPEQWQTFEELVRDAYRLHWGTTHQRHVLAATSHRYLVNDLTEHVVDILRDGCNPQLAILQERNLLNKVQEVLRTVQLDYLTALGRQPDVQDHVLSAGPLVICAINAPQDDSTVVDNTRNDAQWRQLRRHLANPDIHCVAICSNVPFLASSALFHRTSDNDVLFARRNPGQYNEDSYEQSWGTDCPEHLAVLLELIAHWLEPRTPLEIERRVLLLARNPAGFAFQSDIRVARHQPTAQEAANTLTIKQIGCGALVPQSVLWRGSHTRSTSPTTAADDTPFPTNGTFETRSFHFDYIHHSFCCKASCAIVDIARKGAALEVAARLLTARDPQTALPPLLDNLPSLPKLRRELLAQQAQTLTYAVTADPSFPSIAQEASGDDGASTPGLILESTECPVLSEATEAAIRDVANACELGSTSVELLAATTAALLCSRVAAQLDQIFFGLHRYVRSMLPSGSVGTSTCCAVHCSGQYGSLATKPSACEGVTVALHTCWCSVSGFAGKSALVNPIPEHRSLLQLPFDTKQLLCYPTRLAVVDTIECLWDGLIAEQGDLLSGLDGLACRQLTCHVFVLAALHAEATATSSATN